MFCPKCGSKLEDGAAYCASCGHKLSFVPTKGDEILPEEPILQENGIGQEIALQEQEAGQESTLQDNEIGQKEPVPEYKEEAAGRETVYEDAADTAEQRTYVSRGIEEYYEDKPAVKKSRKPLFIGLGIAAAAVVVLLVLFFTGTLFPKRELEVAGAYKKTTEAIANRSELLKFTSELAETGKVGIELEASNIGEMIGAIAGEFLPNMSDYLSYLSLINIGADASVSADRDGNISGNLDINLFGNDATAGYYVNASGDGDIAFSFPLIFDRCYGISLDNVAMDLDLSVFAPGSGTKYEMSPEDYESLKASLLGMKNAGKTAKAADYLELFLGLYKNTDTKIDLKKGKETTDAGDGDINCVTYTAEIDEAKAVAIADYVAAWFGKKAAAQGLEGISQPGDIAGMISEQLLGSGFTATVKIYVYNGYLVKVGVDGSLRGEDVNFMILIGSDPSVSDTISATAKYGDFDATASIDMSKSKDEEFGLNLRSDALGLNTTLVFDYDKTDSAFEISSEDGAVSLTGQMKLNEDSLKIADPILSLDGGSFRLNFKGISADITKDAHIQKISEDFPEGYTDILKMSESEVDQMVDQVNNIFVALLSMAFGG